MGVKSEVFITETTENSEQTTKRKPLSYVLRKPAGEDGSRWSWRRGIHLEVTLDVKVILDLN